VNGLSIEEKKQPECTELCAVQVSKVSPQLTQKENETVLVDLKCVGRDLGWNRARYLADTFHGTRENAMAEKRSKKGRRHSGERC